MGILQPIIEKYVNEISPLIDGKIGRLQSHAYNMGYPIIEKQTALFLASLITAIKPKKILEIGCCIGFSSGLMSEFLDEGGHITTIDRYDIMIDKARKNFKEYDWEDKITLLEGEALEILKNLDNVYDFIFIDAAKAQYIQFLPYCIKILRVGGVLLADDILLNSYAAMDRYQVPRRHRTTHKRMREFIYALTNTDGLQSSLLTIGDGLLMSVKTKENIIINTGGRSCKKTK